MPTPEEILRGLSQAANQWLALAIGWHVAIAAVIGALAFGWRPGRRATGLMLASLCASVAVVAVLAGNPFNGSIFGLLTGALVVLALRLSPAPLSRGAPTWAVVVGWLLAAFGLVYPHFLDQPAAMYLIAAPVGVVPCPTLAVVIGFSLLAAGLQSRAWCWVLVAAGAFYGIFGVVRLGVVLDMALFVGTAALGLIARNLRATRSSRTQPGAGCSCPVATESRSRWNEPCRSEAENHDDDQADHRTGDEPVPGRGESAPHVC